MFDITIILLVGSACGAIDLDYPTACYDGPLWKAQVDYQNVQEMVNVVYVVDHDRGRYAGHAFFAEHYAIAEANPAVVRHEINHLEEGTLCTSDGMHDGDPLCQYERLEIDRA